MDREKSKERLIQRRSDASIGRLAGGVAHFIKNSLWNIGGRAQLLLKETSKTDAKYKHLDTIRRRTEDADKVVKSLLNFARGRGETTKKTEVQLGEKMKSVLELLAYDLDQHGITVRENIDNVDLMVIGIEFELQEVFLNIIQNAMAAMPKGGILSINVTSKEKEIEVEISDDGLGMTEETRENVFMPFHNTRDKAFGFGLYETKRTIDKHNGTISVRSQLNKGTSITMRFPKCR
jgi:signal transduction histidine kinase